MGGAVSCAVVKMRGDYAAAEEFLHQPHHRDRIPAAGQSAYYSVRSEPPLTGCSIKKELPVFTLLHARILFCPARTMAQEYSRRS